MYTLTIDHGAAKCATSAGHVGEPQPAAGDTRPAGRAVMPPVTVNGIMISRKAIASEVQNCPAPDPGDGWRRATRALVIRELLLQEARRLDIQVEPKADPDGRLETIEDALVRALVEREVRIPQADEATLRRFYDNNRRRFMTAALYEADHILFAARRDNKYGYAAACDRASALEELLAREPDRFSELAREFSDCPSAALGGSLGQIGPGDTTLEFETALMSLASGEISSPVETRYGIHLIRLRRRIDGRQLPFEAVSERIESYLGEHVRRQAMAQYIALLIGRADIRGIALEGAASPLVQ
jgi:peptidyl-prolyl cis-trans isomerase C